MGAESVHRRKGFTLIEILVVVAIIALLISILLPSLARARDQAKSAVCQANLGQLGRAENSYQTTNGGYIPGSPLTTGYAYAKYGIGWTPAAPGFDKKVIEWGDYATPLRTMMEGAKSIPTPTVANAAEVRKAIYMKLTEGPFHCPMNPQVARPWSQTGSTSDWPTIRATSYMTFNTITRGGTSLFSSLRSNPSLYAGAKNAYDIAQDENWDVKVPAGYMPRHDRLGRESIKAFLADGLRFLADDGTNITYSTELKSDSKGLFMATPPSTATTANNREYVLARQYSYRHGQNSRINVGFFDGHVESLQVTFTTTGTDYTGRAISPQYYYPSGSVVENPAGLHKSSIPKGTVLP